MTISRRVDGTQGFRQVCGLFPSPTQKKLKRRRWGSWHTCNPSTSEAQEGGSSIQGSWDYTLRLCPRSLPTPQEEEEDKELEEEGEEENNSSSNNKRSEASKIKSHLLHLDGGCKCVCYIVFFQRLSLPFHLVRK
jgi:hypothetical protein